MGGVVPAGGEFDEASVDPREHAVFALTEVILALESNEKGWA